MDRKSIIIVVISFLLLVLWFPLTNYIWPPQPAPRITNQVALQTNIPASTQAVTVATSAPPTIAPTTPLVTSDAPEKLLELETSEARYIFTSYGGGLKHIELKEFPAVVACNDKEVAPTNRVRLNTFAALPVMALLGGEAVQGDGVYTLSQTGQTVRAEKTLVSGLRVIKDFTIGTNYLIACKMRLENQSQQPLSLPSQELSFGTASIFGARDDPSKLAVYWFDKDDKHSVDEPWFANRSFFGCGPSSPRYDYLQGNNNVSWAALQSQFFALALVPKEPAASIHVVRASLLVQTNPAPFGLRGSLVYPAAMLTPNQAIERDYNLYAGPKEYKRLVRLSRELKAPVDLIMDYDGFFGWFAQVLLSSMNAFYGMGLNYAMAIIVITIIIKLLFWPLTNASTKSMKRMAALQPQMKAIQEKYKDDPAKMNRKMMEFMKENRVSPLGGCLPMLLQIPVFFGFFKMIQSAIELRGAQFLWACDLSKPDTLFVIPGLNFPFNPLPLIMGATMLWQARLTPPSPGMDPMQQKIMKYMPLMFLFILYNFSAGLTLYWTVQNLLTIAQMKVTKTKDEPPAGAPAPGAAKGPAPKAPLPPPKKRK